MKNGAAMIFMFPFSCKPKLIFSGKLADANESVLVSDVPVCDWLEFNRMIEAD